MTRYMKLGAAQAHRHRLTLASVLFVLMWTSGFIVGALGTRAVPALDLTAWRFTLAAVALTALALAVRAPWPRSRRQLGNLAITGLLMQATQFTFVYLALERGVPAALASLVMSIAPLLVSAGASVLFAERLAPRQWLGLAIGLGGVALAVATRVTAIGDPLSMLLLALGTLGLAGGTLYQRRHGAASDARTGQAVQLAVAAVVVVPVALLTDGLHMPLTFAALGPLAWLGLGNSIGAMLLLGWLLRHGRSSATASLLYVVPPLTAIVGVPVLNQPMSAGVVAGLVVTLAGVALVRRAPARTATPAVAEAGARA